MENRHVALLIETSREYGRGLLRGIIKYQNDHGFWSVYFKPHGLGIPPPSWLRTWRGDGIFGASTTGAWPRPCSRRESPP